MKTSIIQVRFSKIVTPSLTGTVRQKEEHTFLPSISTVQPVDYDHNHVVIFHESVNFFPRHAFYHTIFFMWLRYSINIADSSRNTDDKNRLARNQPSYSADRGSKSGFSQHFQHLFLKAPPWMSSTKINDKRSPNNRWQRLKCWIYLPAYLWFCLSCFWVSIK